MVRTATGNHAAADQQRRASLATFEPTSPVAQLAVTTALEVVMQNPAVAEQTDRRRLGVLAALFDRYLAVHGDFDPSRALARAEVDAFIGTHMQGHGRGTISTYRSDLSRYGRLYHPDAYPKLDRRPARATTLRPYMGAEVARMWQLTSTVTDKVARRMQLIIALAAGAGARANEMTTLVGASVRVVLRNGARTVCVDLPSRRSGVIRTVPIVDQRSAMTLRAAAEAIGPDDYLLSGTGKRTNVVNRTRSHLQQQQPGEEFSAVRLRHFWIVRLASSSFPTAAVLHLADLGDSHTLTELRPYFRQFDDTELLDWMREVSS
ncbi:hypothetical protein ACFWH7_16625 [Cellulosimicrobium cellulans]|uniref:hypothetical protein n=1 Tax=Cellulosimicrobium cellulans TaxID=1710 RepID=UPI0036523C34